MSSEQSEIKDIVLSNTESIKIMRGMMGKYGWEIKTLDMDIERLKQLNGELNRAFGGIVEDE